MTSWKKALPFLLLNVLVSALTTFLVLTWWEQSHRTAMPAGQNVPASSSAAQATQPPASIAPVGDTHISIENVFGAGNYQTEAVEIRRESETDLVLTGWKLRDENGHEYTFPNLTLKNGAIRIYTRSGSDSVIELFWGLSDAVWGPGEMVTLVDPQGTLRASYQIP